MRAKKLIEKIVDFLDISDFSFNTKKRALKVLLKKLKEKKASTLKELENEHTKDEEHLLKEELNLLSLHIDKAKKKIDLL